MYPAEAPPPRTIDPRLDALGLVCAVLGGIDFLWGLALPLLSLHGASSGVAPGGSEAYRTGYAAGSATFVCLSAVGLLLGPLTAYAGMRMRAGEAYGLCLAVVVANMLPCVQTACCGMLGIPFGIWALIVLFDDAAKASFRR